MALHYSNLALSGKRLIFTGHGEFVGIDASAIHFASQHVDTPALRRPTKTSALVNVAIVLVDFDNDVSLARCSAFSCCWVDSWRRRALAIILREAFLKEAPRSKRFGFLLPLCVAGGS